MSVFDFADRRNIEIRASGGVKTVPAWCIGDFGVCAPFGEWFVVHLPSGQPIAAIFPAAENALQAAQELTKLRNTWAGLSADELPLHLMMLICLAYDGELIYEHGTNIARKGLNGYDPN